ncbi:MAG: DUF452 family protein [Muribaculaceae bacterium]|nr:DUF452 family protein [Muribaculaceae bacterium]
MKHAYIQRNGAPRLIVIFAGWGMDATPFAGLSRTGYDIMAVWDYRTLDFDPSWTSAYQEVCVLAWSMGVHASAMCDALITPAPTGRVAVGGTLYPVSDTKGIPETIFAGTLDGLDEASLERFMRRMCGGAKAYAEFCGRRPARPVQELREELRAIGTRSADCCPDVRFDHYVLTARDAIFPPANQRAAFEGTDTVVLDSPHLPDFQKVLDEFFIDKTLVTERFDSARATYDDNAEAQALTADYLAALLRDTDTRAILSDPEATILEIGCGTGMLSRRIASMQPAARMLYWDISPTPPDGIRPDAYTCCDAELAIRKAAPASLDMIVSASTMQWFNSPEGFVASAMRALRPGGILAVSTFGPDNLRETAQASGVGLHLADRDTWTTAVGAMRDAEILTIEQKLIQCRFDNALDSLRSLSLTGVNALSRNGGGTARSVARAMQPDADGRYTITYQPLFIMLRKKA